MVVLLFNILYTLKTSIVVISDKKFIVFGIAYYLWLCFGGSRMKFRKFN